MSTSHSYRNERSVKKCFDFYNLIINQRLETMLRGEKKIASQFDKTWAEVRRVIKPFEDMRDNMNYDSIDIKRKYAATDKDGVLLYDCCFNPEHHVVEQLYRFTKEGERQCDEEQKLLIKEYKKIEHDIFFNEDGTERIVGLNIHICEVIPVTFQEQLINLLTGFVFDKDSQRERPVVMANGSNLKLSK